MKSFLKSVGAAVRWHRRSLAALAAVVAVAATLSVLRPAPPPTRAVVVAAAAVPAGTTLTAAMVKVAHLPTQALPEGALADPVTVLGSSVVVPIPRGAVLTKDAFVDGSRQLPRGQVLVPLRLGDSAVVAMLRVGDLVSVVGRDQQGRPIVLARGVRVSAVPRMEVDTGPMAVNSSSGGLVLVQTDAETGAQIALAATSGGLGVLLG